MKFKPIQRRKCLHSDPRFFNDAEPVNGIIRTTCKECKRWIGNRPVEVKKGK